MQKLKTFFRRVKTMSLSRMLMYARKACKDSGKSIWLIIPDMVYCVFKYEVGYLDYLTFGFAHLNAEQRKTYMTMNDNLRLVRNLNDSRKKDLFEDKLRFISLFGDYINRDWLDLQTTTSDGLRSFAEKHPVFFAKESNNFGGHGVTRIGVDKETDFDELYARLTDSKQYLLEQMVVQHPEMNRLCPKSVNTIRVVTIEKEGQISVMYSLVRMGSGDSFVDNISSGGMYAPINESGIITAPAFCESQGEYYDVHPNTGTHITGFKIPMFKEGIELVKRAAKVVDEVRYVGWDVAISTDGPVIIEGNTIPGYDMCQNYHHLGERKIGIKPRFIEILGNEF
ncbi:MAG: sugar-transfer associated ATP-grasp domain-containing protein [Oscillospiraceae bacterium]